MSSVLELTFDDGPDARWTPQVLDALERAGARATFFMVGERVRQLPAVVRAVMNAGHDVQLHCHRHIRHSELGALQIELDTCRALTALAAVGVRPTRWRTPWGVRVSATRAIAEIHGLRLVGWTIDTHDWRGDSVEKMLSRASASLAAGGMVLMHDGLGPGAWRDGCASTVELIGRLVDVAREQGCEVAALERHRDAS